MTDDRLPLDDLADLAEREMAEKREIVGDEARSRELWDIPSESDAKLAEQQTEETKRQG